MQPDTWLAWWVCGMGSRNPTFFQFVSETGAMFILALASKTRIVVSRKFMDRLVMVDDPQLVHSDAFQLQSNRALHGDGGQLAPQAAKAMAAAASPAHADSLYNERWRSAK